MIAHSSLQQDWGENQKSKSQEENLGSWSKDRFRNWREINRKEKKKRGKKQVMQRHHLPAADQCPASVQTMAALERLTPVLLLFHGMEHTFGQLRSAVSSVSSHRLLFTRSQLAEGMEWEAERALMLCKDYLATAKVLGCYQHGFSHKSKPLHHIGCLKEIEMQVHVQRHKSSTDWW